MSWPVRRSLVVCPNSLAGRRRSGQGYYRVDEMCRLDHYRSGSHNKTPEYLKRRQGLRGDILKNILGVATLIESAAG